MEGVLRSAARAFASERHLIDVVNSAAEWLPMYDDDGNLLERIRGRAGACGVTAEGQEIGVDLIEMDAGTAFPLHVHPGDHLLYGLEGEGGVTVNGTAYRLSPGVTVFIAAEQPHGVNGPSRGRLRFLAFGVPHKHVSSSERMQLLHDEAGHEDRTPTKHPPSS